MSDVVIKFEGDITALNKVIDDLQKTGKRAADAVQKPMEKLLESDKKVERGMANMVRSITSAITPAEAFANVLDSIESTLQTSLGVGIGVGVGMALNQALGEAARGMTAFSEKAEKLMSKPFKGAADEVSKIQDMIADMASDIQDDGFLERWIFGKSKDFLQGNKTPMALLTGAISPLAGLKEILQGTGGDTLEERFFGSSKEDVLSSMEKALELAKELAAANNEADSGRAMDAAFRRNIALRGKSAQGDGTIEGDEYARRAVEESQMLEMQIRQVEELYAAEQKLKAAQADPLFTDQARKFQKEIYDQVVVRHQVEREAMAEEISSARDRRALEGEMYALSVKHGMEQLTIMSDREKLNLNLEQSEERLATLSQSKEATEKEINAALADQAKMKFAILQFNKSEVDASANISRLLLERRQIGKSDLDQQKFKIQMLQSEADGMEMNLKGKKDQEALDEKLNQIEEERLNLKRMQRAEEEKIRDINRQRIQMAETDPYLKARNNAQWAQEDADRMNDRADASQSEKQAAMFAAELARRGVVDAAVTAAPSLNDVANADSRSMQELRRNANRGGLDKASQARQAQARFALADAQAARDPYGPGRERSKRTRRQAQIQADRATGNLTSRSAEEMDRLRGLSDNEYEEERRNRISEREKESRESEERGAREKWERDHPLDAKKKREGKPYDESKDPDKIGKSEEPKTSQSGPGQEQDPMLTALQSIAAWTKSPGVLDSMDKKLPIEITN